MSNTEIEIEDNLDLDTIRDLIIGFNNDPITQKLQTFYESKSYAEIIGASRRELPHSAFLAWILSPNENHGLGLFTLRKLLELVSAKGVNSQEIGSNYNDHLLVSDFNLRDIEIETERAIQGGRRLDIYISGKINIDGIDRDLKVVIENKVTTKEHSDQTIKYFEYFEAKKKSTDLVFYIYLTPISTIDLEQLDEPECSCKHFIHINYQLLVDYLMEPVLNKDVPQRTKNLINEYLLSLSQPSFEEDDTSQKQELIMALGSEERELLTRFWNKNQRLIYASLYAISVDPNQDQEVIDSAKSALNSLSGSNKDRSLYSIYWNGQLEFQNFKKSDIGLNIVLTLEKYNFIDNDVFKFLRSDKSCSFPLLKKASETTDTERKYRKYRINGEPELVYNEEEYFIARNWGVGSIAKFNQKMEKSFPLLKIEKVG